MNIKQSYIDIQTDTDRDRQASSSRLVRIEFYTNGFQIYHILKLAVSVKSFEPHSEIKLPYAYPLGDLEYWGYFLLSRVEEIISVGFEGKVNSCPGAIVELQGRGSRQITLEAKLSGSLERKKKRKILQSRDGMIWEEKIFVTFLWANATEMNTKATSRDIVCLFLYFIFILIGLGGILVND